MVATQWTALFALLALVSAVAAGAAPGEEGRSLRRAACTEETPCGQREGSCQGSDNNCLGELVCLSNNNCGSTKSKLACSRARRCGMFGSKRCRSSSDCLAGLSCKLNRDVGHKVCGSPRCQNNLEWMVFPEITRRCGTEPSSRSRPEPGRDVSEGCGCSNFLEPTSQTCVDDCSSAVGGDGGEPANECPAGQVMYSVKPCPNVCSGEPIMCAMTRVAVPGCGCPEYTEMVAGGPPVCRAAKECPNAPGSA